MNDSEDLDLVPSSVQRDDIAEAFTEDLYEVNEGVFHSPSCEEYDLI